MSHSPERLRTAVVGFPQLVVEGEIAGAFDQHVGAGFVHHRAGSPPGADGVRGAMEDDFVERPDRRLSVVSTVAEGDRVAVHSCVRFDPSSDGGLEVVHPLRFRAGRIAQMWSVGQPLDADRSRPHQ